MSTRDSARERMPKIKGDHLIVANIPMCDDQGCPSRHNCYRHSASGRLARAENQPYFAEPTRAKDEASCPFFWPVRPQGVRFPRVRRVTVIKEYTIRNDPSQLGVFIRAQEVAKILGCAPSTLEGWLRRPDLDFPKPVKMGRDRLWLRTEITEFLQRDSLRGIGARGRHAWIGATEENPAFPWVHSVPADTAQAANELSSNEPQEETEDE